jgi:DNA-binding HxlR family transcriptional regulator
VKAAHDEKGLPRGTLTSSEGSGSTPGAAAADEGPCRAREVLERVGDKWTLYVVHVLGGGTKRFSELQREIDGITPRMLTVTVRNLERDGLVTRTVYPVVPPRVEYALTQAGTTLLAAVTPLVEWAAEHLGEIDQARSRYDLVTRPRGAAEATGLSTGHSLSGPRPKH